MAVFHDITRQRRDAERMAAANAELAATLADKDVAEAELRAFAGVVAHDLKSPLSSVAGYVEIIEDCVAEPGFPADGTLRHAVERSAAGVRRMRNLIDDLLAYVTAGDAPVNAGPVDLAALVADVVGERTDHLRASQGARPAIAIGDLPAVTADPGLLRQVLDNLVGNALKYVTPGRAAEIDVGAAPDPERPGWVRVEVADRGYAGTGLGLSICQRIVERHRGAIGLEDNPGGGSRFWFTLPAAEVSSPARAAPS